MVTGLKAESDASYYTLINDDWDFANGPVRSTGGRFSMGVKPSVYLNFKEKENFIRDTLTDPEVIESYSSLYKLRTNAWGLDFVSGYSWEKPVNLYWQHSFSADIAYSLYYKSLDEKNYFADTLSSKTGSKIESPNLSLNIGYKVGYYPNTRTMVTLGIYAAYSQFWGNQITNDENEIDIGNILLENNLQFSCYYYISPQLRLTINIGSHYEFTKQNQQQPEDVTGDEFKHNFRNMLDAGLTYSIF